MKPCVLFLLLLLSDVAFGQKSTVSFSAIDWVTQSIDAPTTDSLAKKLTAPYSHEIEKVRAIYGWMATHIAYNMGIFSRRYGTSIKYAADFEDTSTVWKSADEMVADRVLKRRVAVCDGYARLFKTLCDYSGIRSELVLGYVRVEPRRDRFRTNHTWNAVMIDSTWHLVDVTWGSGFVTYSNEFVQKMDDYYFLTPPEQMIRDHYPEDPKWTLLDNPPLFHEFKSSPFKAKAFVKYGINSFSPLNGVIEASVGDTLKIELQMNPEKAKGVASSNYDDSLSATSFYALVEPAVQKGSKVVYNYIVNTPTVAGLQLVYNKDVILQYRVNVKEKVKTELSLN